MSHWDACQCVCGHVNVCVGMQGLAEICERLGIQTGWEQPAGGSSVADQFGVTSHLGQLASIEEIRMLIMYFVLRT